LNTLDSIAVLERLVTFYVEQHNAVMPHSAFDGQTPDEIYRGRETAVSGDLAAARLQARRARIEANRRTAPCGVCEQRAPPENVGTLAGVVIANR